MCSALCNLILLIILSALYQTHLNSLSTILYQHVPVMNLISLSKTKKPPILKKDVKKQVRIAQKPRTRTQKKSLIGQYKKIKTAAPKKTINKKAAVLKSLEKKLSSFKQHNTLAPVKPSFLKRKTFLLSRLSKKNRQRELSTLKTKIKPQMNTPINKSAENFNSTRKFIKKDFGLSNKPITENKKQVTENSAKLPILTKTAKTLSQINFTINKNIDFSENFSEKMPIKNQIMKKKVAINKRSVNKKQDSIARTKIIQQNKKNARPINNIKLASALKPIDKTSYLKRKILNLPTDISASQNPAFSASQNVSARPKHTYGQINAASAAGGYESLIFKDKTLSQNNPGLKNVEKKIIKEDNRIKNYAREKIKTALLDKKRINRLGATSASNLSWVKSSVAFGIKKAADTSFDLNVENQVVENSAINSSAYMLQGSINPNIKQLFVKINDNLEQIQVSQGSFAKELKLEAGLNQVQILAFNSVGQSIKQSISLVYTPIEMQWRDNIAPSDWTTYINDKISGNSYVHSIVADKYNHKWFGLNTGVVWYNNRRWVSYTEKDGLAANQVYAITSDNKGRLWFGTKGGVSLFDRVKWTNYTEKDGLADNRVNAIVMYNNDTLWFGTEGGVSRFDGNKWTSYTTNDGLINNSVNAILVDKQNQLWFGTKGGVSVFNGKSWIKYTTKDGLIDNQVSAIVMDKYNQLWFGTRNGVSCFDGKTWKNYTKKEGLINNRINAIVVDKYERLWFATQGGVSVYDNGYWLNFAKKDGLPSNKVYAVLVESDYRKWFGTDIGVSELNEETAGRNYH